MLLDVLSNAPAILNRFTPCSTGEFFLSLGNPGDSLALQVAVTRAKQGYKIIYREFPSAEINLEDEI